eukprot:1810697-Rhodomonas_salina.1
MFNLELERGVDSLRQQLTLAQLFPAKPRPIWAGPALLGIFGDAFFHGGIAKGEAAMVWSFQLLQHAFQRA